MKIIQQCEWCKEETLELDTETEIMHCTACNHTFNYKELYASDTRAFHEWRGLWWDLRDKDAQLKWWENYNATGNL